MKKEYYQSRQRRIGSSQSGPESSSSGPDDSSSYHFSYGKSNGYGIPSIGVPGRAIVIRCENKEIKKSDPSITKERVKYESYAMTSIIYWYSAGHGNLLCNSTWKLCCQGQVWVSFYKIIW